jgi:hypothetical protein
MAAMTAVDAARAGRRALMRSSRAAQADRRRLLMSAGYGVRGCARGISGRGRHDGLDDILTRLG